MTTLQLASESFGELAADDMRKIRINADHELSRRFPGWLCCFFHFGERLPEPDLWVLVYSVQMSQAEEPFVYKVLIGRIQMADGSQIWGSPLGL